MSAMDVIRKAATPEHKAAGRELATALARYSLAQNPAAWTALSRRLGALLDARERLGLAVAALHACGPQEAALAYQTAVPDPPPRPPWPPEEIGQPMAPFDEVMDEAEWWVGIASRREVRAYAMAALSRMGREERHAMVAAADKAGGG